MNLHLHMIAYFGTAADKMRARRIHLSTQNLMHLPVWIDSGKEDEP